MVKLMIINMLKLSACDLDLVSDDTKKSLHITFYSSHAKMVH